jgi:hypothetical protein
MGWELFQIAAGIVVTLIFVWMLWPGKAPEKSPEEVLAERVRASHEKPKVNNDPVVQLITKSRIKPKRTEN